MRSHSVCACVRARRNAQDHKNKVIARQPQIVCGNLLMNMSSVAVSTVRSSASATSLSGCHFQSSWFCFFCLDSSVLRSPVRVPLRWSRWMTSNTRSCASNDTCSPTRLLMAWRRSLKLGIAARVVFGSCYSDNETIGGECVWRQWRCGDKTRMCTRFRKSGVHHIASQLAGRERAASSTSARDGGARATFHAVRSRSKNSFLTFLKRPDTILEQRMDKSTQAIFVC